MKIEVHDDYCIAVELSKDDMSELDITYDELDYSNIETRRVLWTVLGEASHTIGRDINLSEKMLIEAVPAVSGGCIIYFTVLPKIPGAQKSIKIIKRDEGAVICEFQGSEPLFALAPVLKKRGYEQKSELYVKDGRYRLVLYPEPGGEALAENLLCEYGELIGRRKAYALSATHEFWKLLASPDAIEKLTIDS